MRIIDESGDDYLFHKTQFAFVDFPQAVRKKILALQRPANLGLEPTRQRVRVIMFLRRAAQAAR